MLKASFSPRPRAARSTHIMKAGESLASIALRHFGDARYARLIATINRGDVPVRNDGFSSFAFVKPGQVIVLPTNEEATIFSAHFFTQQSQSKFDLAHYARPAMPSDSIPVSILPSQGSRSAGEKASPAKHAVQAPVSQKPLSLEELFPQFPNIQISDAPAPLMRSGDRGDSQYECQYIVRVPSPAANEVIDMSPPTVKVAALQQGKACEGPEVVAFSQSCRMIKFEVEGGQSDTIIKLQVLEETRWQTVTAYVITEQHSRRLMHYAEKQQRAVDFNLPSAVAKELSISDLKRNWKDYVQCYINSRDKVAAFQGQQKPMFA